MEVLPSKDIEGQHDHMAAYNSDSKSPKPTLVGQRRRWGGARAFLTFLALYTLVKLTVYVIFDNEAHLIVPGHLEYPFLRASRQGELYADLDVLKVNVERSFL